MSTEQKTVVREKDIILVRMIENDTNLVNVEVVVTEARAHNFSYIIISSKYCEHPDENNITTYNNVVNKIGVMPKKVYKALFEEC